MSISLGITFKQSRVEKSTRLKLCVNQEMGDVTIFSRGNTVLLNNKSSDKTKSAQYDTFLQPVFRHDSSRLELKMPTNLIFRLAGILVFNQV
ncbi:hypothetical protein EGC78_20330 [Shewanella frigidimarina]|nr:hypothetical protein EGC78_20330 [Shewanella frigidimarina]